MSSTKKIPYLGMSLIELLLVIGILGILVAVAVPSYQKFVSNAEMLTTTGDIKMIEQKIERFSVMYNRLPLNTAELGSLPDDPWGAPYVYLNIGIQKGKGKLRKDKNLVPINTDYDLYSKGPDGRSVSPLTAKHSRDDIIRANNGAYIGVAEAY